MEKKRGNQIMAIAALFIAVIGLSLGFAAFSNTLTIKSSATVRPDASVFDVNFSSSESSTATSAIAPVLGHAANETTTENSEFTATTAEIVNDAISAGETTNATIQNIAAHFTAPGQEVSYVFWVRNDGKLEAFLNGVTFANVTGQEVPKYCSIDTTAEVENRATQSLVDAACAGISIKVVVGGVTTTTNSDRVTSTGTEFTGSVANGLPATTGKKLTIQGDSGDRTPIVVTITYASGDQYRVDGPMNVAFGDITLTYGSVDGECATCS